MCLALAFPAGAADDGPYVPENDAQVLERLPAASELEQLAPLRTAVRNQPARLQPAPRLARTYIELARKTADPRYLGYAEATLAPWRDGPASVQVLQATIAQSRHEFEQALTLLDTVLSNDPDNAQARLTRATILQVRGQLDRAAADCRRLADRATALVVTICHSGATSLNGRLEAAYHQLAKALKAESGAAVPIRVWGLTLLGEMAVRLGRPQAATRHFRAALALDDDDIYLLAAYADLLLARGEDKTVTQLLSGRESQDVLLLRLALAGAGSTDGAHWARMLADRFAAAARRDDSTHAREHARFALDIGNNPDAALKLARQNWRIQKEPADILILLRAAAAASQPQAAVPALNWMAEHHYEDAQTASLARKLRAELP